MSRRHPSEEREVKLAVDDGFALPSLEHLAGVTTEDCGDVSLRAVYWDTDDLALAHSGVALRHRNGTWTYKGRTRYEGDCLVREEREVEAPPTEIPDALRAVAGQWAEMGRLRAVADVVTDRHTILVRRRDQGVEVVHDRVTVQSAGEVVDSFSAVEVEYEMSSTELADDVVARLVEDGAVVDRTAKYVRALRALGYEVPEVSDG